MGQVGFVWYGRLLIQNNEWMNEGRYRAARAAKNLLRISISASTMVALVTLLLELPGTQALPPSDEQGLPRPG